MRREVVRCRPDGSEVERWRNPVDGRFVAAPNGPAAPRAAAKAIPPVPRGAGPAANPQDDGRAADAALPAPDVRQALLFPPPDVGLPGPPAPDAPRFLVDSSSGYHRPAGALGPAPVAVSAADLVARGATLHFHPGNRVVVAPPALSRPVANWERVAGRLRRYVQRQQQRRALYLRACDAGVGLALGWTEHAGCPRRLRVGARLAAAVLRAVLLALVERPRSTLGGVAIAALYRCFPIAEQLVVGGTVEA